MLKNDDNIFPILRYISAFCVMCLHFTGYMRIYVPDQAESIGFLRSVIDFYQPTIVMFAISGFLISASLERNGIDASHFIKKRFFRLYPELWISMLFYLAVLFCVVPEKLDGSIIFWIILQGIGFAATPSCLRDFATGSINGPMWYITVLIQLYGLLYCFKKCTRNSKSKVLYGMIVAICASGNLVAFYCNDKLSSVGQKLLERAFVPYAIFFFVGVVFQSYRMYQKQNAVWTLLCILIVHSLVRIFHFFDYGYYTGLLSGMATAAITIYVAYVFSRFKNLKKLRDISLKLRKTDISYGMYLYHWLFLNLLIYYKLYDRYHWIVCLGIFVLATMVVAFISQKISVKLMIKR